VLIAWTVAHPRPARAQTGYGTSSPTAPLTGTPSLTPIPPTTGPTSTLGQPTFDPYSSQPNTVFSPPSLMPPPTSGYGYPSASGSTQTYSAPPPGSQPYYPPAQPYTGFGTQAPPALYPQGIYGTPTTGVSPTLEGTLKLFQNVRLSHAWLEGDQGWELDINDTYLTSTLAFPNFLWSGQPWFVSPGFGMHLWSGPSAVPGAPSLPSKAYSAFLDMGWRSDPNVAFGVEAAGRLGIYSDFEGVIDASFRPSGNALMRYNITPTLALKAGVEYINRADIKLLPAGGFVWTPSPQTRWDIYFPQPKFSSYLTTLGNRETWWYVGGEYGGGVWTPEVQFDTDDDGVLETTERTLMDINDMRVYIGLQFGPPGSTAVGQRGAFIEAGYVFEREVIFVTRPAESFTLGETYMLRGGIAF
jgi:hypothetical protein